MNSKSNSIDFTLILGLIFLLSSNAIRAGNATGNSEEIIITNSQLWFPCEAVREAAQYSYSRIKSYTENVEIEVIDHALVISASIIMDKNDAHLVNVFIQLREELIHQFGATPRGTLKNQCTLINRLKR